MDRKGSAVWSGGIKDGNGTVSTQSGTLSEAQYNFRGRFEDGPGTNPEELIGAAHAGCYSMALSAVLGGANLTAESIRTTATVTVVPKDGGFAITKVHLDVTARIPGATEEAFLNAAKDAKANCPVSKLLIADITMDARLEA